jgi:hypothetical protein
MFATLYIIYSYSNLSFNNIEKCHLCKKLFGNAYIINDRGKPVQLELKGKIVGLYFSAL